ncbi:hypothetical protein STEG23_022394 [Scotinomys teguina]
MEARRGCQVPGTGVTDGCEMSCFKCPICSKSVASDEMEMHFIMCLSKPRLSYNDDVLTKDAGECVICLEELLQGDTIARLPCLCIYHKRLLFAAQLKPTQ